jgi:class 3 adenylate cyclase
MCAIVGEGDSMNLKWAPPQEQVELADTMPWDMPGSGALRRVSYRTAIRTTTAGAFMYAFAAISCFVSLDQLHHGRTSTVIIALLSIATTLTFAWFALFLSPLTLIKTIALGTLIALPSAGVLTTWFLIATHSEIGAAAVLYLEAPIFGFYMWRRWPAALLVASVAVEYGIVQAWHHDSVGLAVAEWFLVISTVAISGVVIGGIAARAEQLAGSESEARAELAELNSTLSARVAVQVDELDRLGKMRRFLSPQIADAVLSEGSDELLAPHRRRIAVLFCDLRGFTAFTNRAEPEEVVAVLDEYYETAGALLRAHEATIGSYAGDGIMAYFGDPVVRDAPALDAVTAAAEIGESLTALARDWTRRGHQLSYGMGLAYGYATLGVVGFDGRYDYTPLGAVVNLAARLCAAAAPGQVLIDQATQVEVAATHRTTELGGFDLKGFDADVRVHALLTGQAPASVTELRRTASGGRAAVSDP